MVDKKIQFNIVVGGIPQIKSSLKGVTESARSMNLSIQQMHERTAQRIVELERNKASALKRINDTIIGDEEKKARRIAQIEENLSRQVTSIKEREALRIKQMNERFIVDAQNQAAKGIDLSRLGKFASMAGFHRTAQIMNWADQLGIGSKSKKSGGSGVGEALEGLLSKGGRAGSTAGEAVTAPASMAASGAEMGAAGGAEGMAVGALAGASVAVALLPVIVAAKAVEIGFQSVSAQAKYLATSFLGAAAQIGGAKNLEEIMVEGAKNEVEAKAARFAVLPEERLTEEELHERAARLSTRADLGAPSVEEGIAAQKKLSVLTGKQKSYSQDDLEFIAKMSHVGHMPLTESAEIYGRFQAQNKKATSAQLQQSFLDFMAIGQKGSFSINELPEATELMQAGAKLAGDPLKNARTALVAGTIIRPRAGGLQNAGVQVDAFIRQSELAYVEGKLTPEQNKFFNKKGQLTDLAGMTASVVSQSATERARPFARAESQAYLTNIQQEGGVRAEDTTSQQKEKVKALFAEYDKARMTMEEFNKSNHQSISTTDKLKSSFNSITEQLEAALMPILKDLSPTIDFLAKTISENRIMITEAVKQMVVAMMALVPVALEVAKIVSYLGVVFGLFVQALAYMGDAMTGGLMHDTFDQIRQSGDAVAKSQAALAVTLDNMQKSFEDFKNGKGSGVVTIPEVTIVGNPNKDVVDAIDKKTDHAVVRAIQDMHNDLKQHKQPL